MKKQIELPLYIKYLIDKIETHGFKAFIVGGCVRDHLLGGIPSDYDITTNALPGDIKRIFAGEKILDTGIAHGTVTVFVGEEASEITTFRIDGKYLDSRHPQKVEFTGDLTADLSRRDFTMNAVAYNSGFTDPFGGIADIKSGIIRCVGDPEKRFTEDALRILRAVRFQSVLGFDIEEETKKAAVKCRDRLALTSGERILEELKKMLLGSYFERAACENHEIITAIIPELEATVGFEQKSPHHENTVYTHSIKAAAFSPQDFEIRLAMLLHDTGKPAAFSMDESLRGHFYGHEKVSTALAEKALKRLRASGKTTETVLTLIRHHGVTINADTKAVKRWLGRLGADTFFKLLDVKTADNLSKKQVPEAKRMENIAELRAIALKILEEDECFSLKNMALTGKDLLELGIPQGEKIGEILNTLLKLVIEEKLENSYAALSGYVKQNFID